MEASESGDRQGVTTDRLLGGRVSLTQSRGGYRAGLDAALLAAALGPAAGDRWLEAGCGPGGALLAAAARHPDVRFAGVERDPAALALARANIVGNAMQERVEALAGDVGEPFRRLGLAPFDGAFANPPYFEPGVLRGPAPARREAYVDDVGAEAWVGFLLKAVREGGAIVLIQRTERLAELLGLLAPKAGTFLIRPVAPFADAPAKRVLLRATKTGKAPLRLLAPLVLHDATGGKHTAKVEVILRGEAALDWD